MSIKSLILTDFVQDFTVSKQDKLQYGAIYSPFSLIKNMLNLFDPQVFTNKESKWLDTGAGTGYFSMFLFTMLNVGLSTVIKDEEERKTHIIHNMLYLIELQDENVALLKERFGQNANVIAADFLSYTPHIQFDYIIGNPPYNAHGMKKVPTNTKGTKKQDGQTIWTHFLKKSLTLLKPEKGQLCYIVPSIWMKPDKAGIYNLLTSYKIEKLHCLTNTETNQVFKGEAQTPTCYFLLTNININNTNNINTINLYDKQFEKYVNYHYSVGAPLPLFGQLIIQKLQPFILKAGGSALASRVIKTNMPSKTSVFSPVYDPDHFPYPNIKTCLLNGLQPQLEINYSSLIQPYSNKVKLVLAHKMYGFPYLDTDGTYGISNRDNYVIMQNNNNSLEELRQLKAFLSTHLVLYVYEATRYRMKYLEKYAFELLPDITKLPDFPQASEINDKSVAEYFGLDEQEQQLIHIRKNYGRFL